MSFVLGLIIGIIIGFLLGSIAFIIYLRILMKKALKNIQNLNNILELIKKFQQGKRE